MILTLKSPESWNDISLSQYKRLISLEFTEDTILEYRINQVHILNDQYSTDDLMKMSMLQLKTYFNEIEFINTNPVLKDCKMFNIDGKEYIFGDFKNMSLEQWIDCEKYTSLENCHKLISIFYIKPEEYNDKELDKVSEWLNKQPVTEYFWSVSFFLFIHRALELSIKQFSEKLEKNREKTQRIITISKRIDKKLKSVLKWSGYR